MTELKTRPTGQSAEDFLSTVEDESKRSDSFRILNLMKDITGEPPVMWGPSIVGFGSYHYKYASGREADWMLTGFSPRKQNLTIYIMPGFDNHDALLKKLGKFKTGKSCLYINKLEDVDMEILRTLIKESVHCMRARYS